ncbi:MAG: hypothetical protein JKY31_03490 [Rhodobacteraceae bacterium]|nr:hypothetical protein [Paracoccaceae bacterium]
MLKTCEFNVQRDLQFAHEFEGFDRVLHIFNADWHGIRAAAAYAPGQKLAISERDGLDGEAIRHIFGILSHYRIEHIIFQGYSQVAASLCQSIHRQFGSSIRINVVTHVTSAQFENAFEIEMQALLLQQKDRGLISRLGSVKPRFNDVIPEYWPSTIINFGPNLGEITAQMQKIDGAIFVPIENSWRKNLYTNMLAAQRCTQVKSIYAINFPSGLEKICTLDKLRLTSFKHGADLFGFMASMEAQMNVTLAECQPMTQLESFAVGTPCLTGPLRVAEFADDPLIALCEVDILDSPHYLTEALSKVISLGRQNDGELTGMMVSHLEHRNVVAALSYAEFLGL